MKSIGFKNFRKFVDFPVMNFNDITLMVGRNNSGKSTVVKAALALLDFLKNAKADINGTPKMNFDFNSFFDVNLGTFSRALYNRANRSEMLFNITISDYYFEVSVLGDPNDVNQTSADVKSIIIRNDIKGISTTFDFQTKSVDIKFEEKNADCNIVANVEDLTETIKSYKSSLETETDLSKVDGLNSYIKSLEKKLKTFKSMLNAQVEEKAKLDLIININRSNEKLIPNTLRTLMRYADEPSNYTDKRSIEYKQDVKAKELIKNKMQELEAFYSETSRVLQNIFIEYIPAFDIKKSIFFSCKDEADFMSNTIHSYFNEVRNINVRTFVMDWMRNFGIGNDFKIDSFSGEMHTLSILNENSKPVNLSDNGSGSIRLMILTLRIALIINRYYNNKYGRPIIFIEEPELNLHPNLQSKLAEFVEFISQKYSLQFIIETHSEYLIRRSQVLVASKNYKDEEDLENNPFTVYYFPQDGIPYSMNYKISGRFENKFGSGFLDVASDSALTLSRNEIERRKLNG